MGFILQIHGRRDQLCTNKFLEFIINIIFHSFVSCKLFEGNVQLIQAKTGEIQFKINYKSSLFWARSVIVAVVNKSGKTSKNSFAEQRVSLELH